MPPDAHQLMEDLQKSLSASTKQRMANVRDPGNEASDTGRPSTTGYTDAELYPEKRLADLVRLR
jgi:hypothetical protein